MFDFLLLCIIIVVVYVHIRAQWATNNELVVHDIRKPSKNIFEEVCDVRQVFKMKLGDDLATDYDGSLYIRDVCKDPVYVNMDAKTANNVLTKDKKKRYISERNVVHSMGTRDAFLRPPLCAFRHYDYMRGSEGTVSPFRSESYHRHFIYVSEGSVMIRIAPPNVAGRIYIQELAENRMDCEVDAFRTKEIQLEKGDLIYIPAYWWSSIQYKVTTQLYAFKYHTYASVLANLPEML